MTPVATDDLPMSSSDITHHATAALSGRAGHRGSASASLTGGKVIAAWLGSIALHTLIFFGMLAWVFPFSGHEEPPEPPATKVQIVGSLSAAQFSLPRRIED